jgi:hypothetical protein
VSEHLIKNQSSPRVRLRRFALSHFRVVLSSVSLFVFDFLETPFLLTVSRREAFEFERVSVNEFSFFDDEDGGFEDNWRRFGDGPLAGYTDIHVFISLRFVSGFLFILMD